MTFQLAFITSFLLALASCSTATPVPDMSPVVDHPDTDAHLFILAGQSNMAGMDHTKTFLPAISKEFGAQNVIVVKDAEGGQPIRRWDRNWAPLNGNAPRDNGVLYDQLMAKVDAATSDRAIATVTFIWMQGERDARESHGHVYAASLRRLIRQLEVDLNRNDINVVLGRLSDFDLNNEKYPHWTIVRQAHVDVARTRPRTAWVNTDDLNDGLNANGKKISNDLHYSVKGYNTLGQRFAQRAITLIRSNERPSVVLVMADDQGWGDTGYNGHPFVQTPTLDDMAAHGVVFNRFYAAAPVCSPTRASVLTGRAPIRTKVTNHGRYMRPQEHTIAESFQAAGYTTGIFGKVHLGSGQPDSPCNPSGMGFDEWVIGLNFFDNDPYLSRNGTVEHRSGKGSVIVMNDAIEFIERSHRANDPFLAIVWFPSPHDPHDEVPEDAGLYDGREHAGYYGEITLLDEQLGRLRSALRRMNIAHNTIIWYCSDNGGLVSDTAGGRGRKGSVYEGGLRVPSVLEWPARMSHRQIDAPAWTCDLYPTLMVLAGLESDTPHHLDGKNIDSIIQGRLSSRSAPMGFWHGFQKGQATWSDRILKAILEKQRAGAPMPHDPARMRKDVDDFPQFDPGDTTGHAAWLDWPWKLHRIDGETYELYHLSDDPNESTNLIADERHAERAHRMTQELHAWMRSVVRSINGVDY